MWNYESRSVGSVILRYTHVYVYVECKVEDRRPWDRVLVVASTDLLNKLYR